MIKVIISGCLLGEPCRYDGKSNLCPSLTALSDKVSFIPVCPEVLGGLPVPRECAEINEKNENGINEIKVMTQSGRDVTGPFTRGAESALKAVKDSGCVCAVLKARSPSCGHDIIYDGTFSHTRVKGDGIFAAMLKKEGIVVFSEEDIEQFVTFLKNLC